MYGARRAGVKRTNIFCEFGHFSITMRLKKTCKHNFQRQNIWFFSRSQNILHERRRIDNLTVDTGIKFDFFSRKVMRDSSHDAVVPARRLAMLVQGTNHTRR